MKFEVKVVKEVEVCFLQVEANVRYWDDGTINGESREDGFDTPCKEGDLWKPLIDLKSGEILNWTQGTKADLHYKICDEGVYTLLDEHRKEVVKIDGYVPEMMCPNENGYGDYIIMNIDEDGIIQKWKPSLEEFESND